ncbi:MBL fold metallo-hydrolase [Flavobacterium sp. CLA17]|uniref:MBL fold metallo-hydrolase n=1 Tax=Flavobacterium sp. CLA17 TaxID=2724135 RepID=UPI001491CE9B|nr:MBL fold metallo-hydrolase [Flavobacterium sp. CLA17]QSB29227.1 MBL fold metallo-hydrolase [Flavobacterium sp. CLA17]
MKSKFYHSGSISNVFLTVLLFAFGLNFGQSKTTQSGYQVITIGDTEVIALSDGTVAVSANELLTAKEPGSINLLLDRAYLKDPVEVSINTYLIKTPDRLILVDTGAGSLFGAFGGHLSASLKEAGYSPEAITDILITHIHVDHSGGLTLNNKMLFPNAVIHVNQKEIDFWMKRLEAKKEDSRGVTQNRPAFMAMKPYLDAGKVKPFQGDVDLLPQIKTVEFVGHTAGHTVFVLQSKGDKLVFWGDLIHVAAVQLHQPELLNDFDFDQQKAITQRVKAYQLAAKEGYLIAADHISFPGIGRIRTAQDGFVWIPAPYSTLGRNQ